MNRRALLLFERVSERIACVLAAAVLIALIWRADQTLSPDLRLEAFENQYAALWEVDAPVPDILVGPLMSLVSEMSFVARRTAPSR